MNTETQKNAFYSTTGYIAQTDENVSAGIFRPRSNSLPCKHVPGFVNQTTLNPVFLPPALPPKKVPIIPCLTASALIPPPCYSTLAEQDRTPHLKGTDRSNGPYHVYANVVSNQLQDAPSNSSVASATAQCQPVSIEVEAPQSDTIAGRKSVRRSRTDIKDKREFA